MKKELAEFTGLKSGLSWRGSQRLSGHSAETLPAPTHSNPKRICLASSLKRKKSLSSAQPCSCPKLKSGISLRRKPLNVDS